MSQRIRIARVIARLNVGGPARHVAWLTAGLNDGEFESTLITGTLAPGEDDMLPFARNLGVEPVVIGAMSRAISPKDALVVWRLFRLFRRLRPDLVHTHTAKAGTTGRVAALLYRLTTRRRVAIAHTFHGHVLHSYYGALTTRLFIAIERFLARFTDAIVVLSPAQRDELHGRFRIGKAEQYVIVPLGLDLDALAGAPAPASRPFTAGIVGRLTAIKDHAFFLDAVAHWVRTQPALAANAKLLVIGDGELRATLEQRAKLLGLDPHVRFTGTRNDPAVFYRELDLLILTSRNEGTPLSILEAMACGVPALATSVGGVPDLLGERAGDAPPGVTLRERGITIKPGDRDAFARALTLIATAPDLRRHLGEQGRAFVEAHYSKERLLRDIRALVRRLTV